MDAKLTLKYDRGTDILYVNGRSPYREQQSEELGDDVIARPSAEVVLAARIRADMTDLDRVAESIWRQLGKAEYDVDFLGSAAFNLAALYGGIERIFKRIGREVDEDLPTGADMDRLLLLQMSVPQPAARPPVLRPETSDCLEKYRELSDLIWNTPAFKLPLDLIRQRAGELHACYHDLSSDLQTFCAFLDALN